MFQVGDKIVHPMHGAGVIDSIVQKKVNGVLREYYILKLPLNGMLVMIPTHNSEEIGVRPIVVGEEADRVIAAIPGMDVEMDSNWNRRYRENMLRLKSGDLLEVARVVKGLVRRDGERGLSTGERKMLHSASPRIPAMKRWRPALILPWHNKMGETAAARTHRARGSLRAPFLVDGRGKEGNKNGGMAQAAAEAKPGTAGLLYRGGPGCRIIHPYGGTG